MKRIIFTFALVVVAVSALSAQDMTKAIGLRFGGFSGYGGEITYQNPLGNANRLELDLGLNHYGFGLNGVYQWVWDLSELADGFKWYAGVGGGIGSYDFNNTNSGFGIGVLGQVGIEYNFNIPLQLSFDYRPGIYVVPTVYGSYDGICLSVRYKF
ncbi:MAG: hypothetical protein P4L34_05305 [Paludibacter sp.]|nr:hypothetical protein [Paludibacter sp.]